MLSSAFLLLLSNSFLTLRLGNGSSSFPRPLKEQEEAEYVDKWITSGSYDARNKLIEHNLRLVAHIVKKYYSQNSDTDDLISIGTIGLIKGISSYKPDKKVKLATYCSRCIENEILMYFRSLKKTAGDISLSDSIDADGEGNSLSFIDVLACEDDMLEKLSTAETVEHMMAFINTELEPRESMILKLRYGLNGTKALTQKEVAEICKISRSYVSRIEKKAVDKLRKVFDVI